MNRKLQIFASAAAGPLLALSALAQARLEPLSSAIRATDLIGMTVNNDRNEKLGEVADLAVDVESGRIVQVILSTGGFFGRSNALVALPPGALHYNAVDKVLQLDASKSTIEADTRFDASTWDGDTQFNRVTAGQGDCGEHPYFVADNEGYRNAELEGTVASTLPHHMDGSVNTDGARTLDKASKVETASQVEETNNWISTLNPDGNWTWEYYSSQRRANNSWSRLGYVQRASRLMDAPVMNLQGQELGKVENFMVDVSAGRIVAVIISSGGYLGMENELSAVPPAALRFNPDHALLQLDASREMLAGSPHFKAGEWPDFSQPGYASGVYRAYNIEPWFNPNTTTGADITRQNIPDRDNSPLTTLDQGPRLTDVDTEAEIRREIVADRGMSAHARNVKITAIDGRVILCGPVDSAGEKQLIGEIADRIAHAGNVDNQLEVQITVSLN
ncbi:MAG: PRC-barrel domain-containing protein [Verrucomicrobiia bacterium]